MDSSHRIYQDSDGMNRTLQQMCRVEPDWAASRVREGEIAIEKVDRLRGQLQNCVDLLHRMKRHGTASDAMAADKAIDSANKTLYETLIR